MRHEAIETAEPRRLVRAWWVLRDGLPAVGRYRRYIVSLALPLALIWGLALAYLLLAPDRFTSKMTLILPGSGVGGSLTVNEIGQASSLTSSAFSSSTLSPTENYKRLLMGDGTLFGAATRLRIAPEAYPAPDVRLTDQTNLIEVSVKGTSPHDAKAKLEALHAAFLQRLDDLRADEADKRGDADREEIARLQRKAHEAQQRLLDFQGRSGLVSVDQFRARMADLDALRARYRESLTDLEREDAQTRRLARSLGSNVDGARIAMLLKADPEFQTLLGRYAQIRSGLAEKQATLGERHALVSTLDAQAASLRGDLARRGADLSGLAPQRILRFVDLAVSDGRAALYQALVSTDSQASGARAASREIARQIAAQNRETGRMVEDASRLADLDRDLKVADAVFSSALARLDTNRADPFASYPLVQTLQAPSLPVGRTSPSLVLALAGAVAASLLVLIGFGLAWIRQPIIQFILQKL
ncbi:hypothetical protein HT136_17115 [Novosphingobium profundi]|uniref:hypothetical protein n=1 Tax=Novosphingobium profundi TaxID=1774954 RepID=UPI001BDB0DCA|nr:hypothetical protein [Novosphingobium profundi]MBT0670089.1 hypothetical protein [Novosphingobium profundi]